MTVAEELVKKLIEKNYSISCAESCTGGKLTGSIVDVADASKVLQASVVTYSNEAKHRILGVSEETLRTRGAVSEETAREMANGLHHVTGAEICITTTGIAGPGGETEEKPVGLVYIGIYVLGKIVVIKHIFKGNRTEVREQAVNAAFLKVMELISKSNCNA